MIEALSEAMNAEKDRLARKRKKKPLERDIQRKCLDWLARQGIPAWRNSTGVMQVKDERLPAFGGSVQHKPRYARCGTTGQADISGLLPGSGRRLEIEVKRPGEKQSSDQRGFGEVIKAAGGIYLVVHSLEELEIEMGELWSPF